MRGPSREQQPGGPGEGGEWERGGAGGTTGAAGAVGAGGEHAGRRRGAAGPTRAQTGDHKHTLYSYQQYQ